MPMRFYCEACTSRIKVPDGTAGKLVKCPGCGHAQRVPHESDENAPQQAVASEPMRARKSSKPSSAETEPAKSSPEVSQEVSVNVNSIEDVADPLSDHGVDATPQANEELDKEHVVEVARTASVLPDKSAELAEAGDGEEVAQVAHIASDESPANTDSPTDDEPAMPEVQQGVESLEEDLSYDAGPADEPDEPEEFDEAPIEAEVDSYRDEVVAEPWPADTDADADIDVEDDVAEEYYPVATPVPQTRSRSGRREHSRNTPANGGTGLLIVGWMLRVLAVMSVAGVVKILLLMSDAGSSVIDMVFVAPILLGFVAMFWAVGELSLAARGRLRDN